MGHFIIAGVDEADRAVAAVAVAPSRVQPLARPRARGPRGPRVAAPSNTRTTRQQSTRAVSTTTRNANFASADVAVVVPAGAAGSFPLSTSVRGHSVSLGRWQHHGL